MSNFPLGYLARNCTEVVVKGVVEATNQLVFDGFDVAFPESIQFELEGSEGKITYIITIDSVTCEE